MTKHERLIQELGEINEEIEDNELESESLQEELSTVRCAGERLLARRNALLAAIEADKSDLPLFERSKEEK